MDKGKIKPPASCAVQGTCLKQENTEKLKGIKPTQSQIGAPHGMNIK